MTININGTVRAIVPPRSRKNAHARHRKPRLPELNLRFIFASPLQVKRCPGGIGYSIYCSSRRPRRRGRRLERHWIEKYANPNWGYTRRMSALSSDTHPKMEKV